MKKEFSLQKMERDIARLGIMFRPPDAEQMRRTVLDHAQRVLNRVDEYALSEDDHEFYTYLQEFVIILELVRDAKDDSFVRESLQKYINNLCWNNFEAEECEEHDGNGYYTLGSMFWNKFNWTVEGCKNELIREFAEKVVEDVKLYLDEIELLANSK